MHFTQFNKLWNVNKQKKSISNKDNLPTRARDASITRSSLAPYSHRPRCALSLCLPPPPSTRVDTPLLTWHYARARSIAPPFRTAVLLVELARSLALPLLPHLTPLISARSPFPPPAAHRRPLLWSDSHSLYSAHSCRLSAPRIPTFCNNNNTTNKNCNK